jgi:type IV pilus assembly protein PilC
MLTFNYTAVNKSGEEVNGKINASDLTDARQKIKQQELYLVKIEIQTEKKLKKEKSFKKILNIKLFENSSGKVSQKDFTACIRQLATLLNAGIPLTKSLYILEDQQKANSLKRMLKKITEDVENGSSFSDALKRYPKSFDSLFISMVKSGEASGSLEPILNRLADFAEQSQLLKSKVKAASIYPLVVSSMAIIISIVLLVVVVPNFKNIFKELAADLPLPTVILIELSSFFQHNWWMILGASIGMIFLFKFVKKFKLPVYYIDKLKLKIPVVGELIKKINIARFTRTLGTLVSSDVPILQALEIAEQTCTNVLFSRTISAVRDSIKEGEGIAEPLKRSGVFSPVVVNMIAVGEETGALEGMLIKVADIYESEIDITIDSVFKLIEPVLIILMALVVGYIVIAMFLPLISLMSAVGS